MRDVLLPSDRNASTPYATPLTMYHPGAAPPPAPAEGVGVAVSSASRVEGGVVDDCDSDDVCTHLESVVRSDAAVWPLVACMFWSARRRRRPDPAHDTKTTHM
jgi:hypothetical protein